MEGKILARRRGRLKCGGSIRGKGGNGKREGKMCFFDNLKKSP